MGQISFPSFLSEKEAATYFSVSLSTIRRWRRAKTGPAFFKVHGVLRYRREALEAFIAKNTKDSIARPAMGEVKAGGDVEARACPPVKIQ